MHTLHALACLSRPLLRRRRSIEIEYLLFGVFQPSAVSHPHPLSASLPCTTTLRCGSAWAWACWLCKWALILLPALSPQQALLAIACGSLLGAGLLGWMAKIACDTGLSSAALITHVYGRQFAKLPIVLNLVQLDSAGARLSWW